jgi:hypothetical protein
MCLSLQCFVLGWQSQPAVVRVNCTVCRPQVHSRISSWDPDVNRGDSNAVGRAWGCVVVR